jgi:diguanylate cyclase (GGDEF)-like protein
MFFIIYVITLFFIVLAHYLLLKRKHKHLNSEYKDLIDRQAMIKKANKTAKRRFTEFENRIGEIFFAYELARDISSILEEKELFTVFKQKIANFGKIEDISWGQRKKGEWINYKLNSESPRYLSVLSRARKVKEHLPLFVHQLNISLERIRLYRQLEELSITDSLTQVYNRRYFMKRFYEEFNRAVHFDLELSFLMIDVDHFKKINDTYGHMTGDVILADIAQVLKDNIREIDFVARFGGEEFSIILPETTKGDAISTAKRIVKGVADNVFRAFDERINVTVSIGVATYPENSSYQDMLIEVADKALYKAKDSGRNQVGWF